MSKFPNLRLRRMRRTDSIRNLTRETSLSVDDLICPVFVIHGQNVREEITPIPGYYHLSLDQLPREINEIANLGIHAVLLFGLPDYKDPQGSGAYASNGIIQNAIRVAKREAPGLTVVTDVCLCEYTNHGHCGILDDSGVNNDQTLGLLSRIALSHGEAGADIVAPSAMMDGQVGAIRAALDKNNLSDLPIMAYSAKYASSFYDPFRVAADSTPITGDRRSYQMDSGNVREAMREIRLDLEEGADIIMIKPALAYLDVIARARREFEEPLCAYNVSGEYSMVKAAEHLGWIDGNHIALEVLTGIKRAGADIIISYHAKEVAQMLQEAHSV